MISEIEQEQINQIAFEKDLHKAIAIAESSHNPLFLQSYASAYNWDDGFSLPEAIANNNCCDLGTALPLFWLAEGMSFITGEVEVNEYNKDWARFCELVSGKLLSNVYPLGPVSFTPNISKVTKF